MERRIDGLRELVSVSFRNLVQDLTTNKVVFGQQIAASLAVLVPAFYLLRNYFKPRSTRRSGDQADATDFSDNVGLGK